MRTTKGRAGITLLLVLCGLFSTGAARRQPSEKRQELGLAIGLRNVRRVRELIAQGADVNELSEEKTPLYEAVKENNVTIAALLVHAGADVNRKCVRFIWDKPRVYEAPLHAAVWTDRSRNKEMVQFLLGKGANINAKDTSGDTPLHEAIENGHGQVASLLIRKGADLHAKRKNGHTPLEMIVHAEDQLPRVDKLKVMGLLLARGCKFGSSVFDLAAAGQVGALTNLLDRDPELVRAKGRSQCTALHWAALMGHLETVKLLLEKGADPNAEGYSFQAYPLHFAAIQGHVNVAKALIAKGAKVKHKLYPDPLRWAAEAGQAPMCQLLIAHGARPTTRDLREGVTSGSVETVKILFDGRGDTEVKRKGPAAVSSLLHIPARNGSVRMVKLLLEKGADPNTIESEEMPLFRAAWRQYAEMVKVLLDAGADPNTKGPFGNTPLHMAVSSADTVKLLLDSGADVNARNNKGDAPLHKAASWGNPHVVRLLLDAGADINAKGLWGYTALHQVICTEDYSKDVIKLLIERGANLQAKTEEGKTPLSVARSVGKHQRRGDPRFAAVIKLLEKAVKQQEQDKR